MEEMKKVQLRRYCKNTLNRSGAIPPRLRDLIEENPEAVEIQCTLTCNKSNDQITEQLTVVHKNKATETYVRTYPTVGGVCTDMGIRNSCNKPNCDGGTTVHIYTPKME